ncbi:hypothetical protein MKW98_002626 [Papaver atlanticum]|uniref:Uncharacterized protein n=1 Tax=Papaver atlanticum TaxID=357466 RepID=A0AAD4SAG5_9MAGN|nr:hypothetical protein MKW98_002626 [Papaver atlanticum]
MQLNYSELITKGYHFLKASLNSRTSDWFNSYTMAASSASSGAKSMFQSLKKYFKKPWEYTGPCASPEYKLAVPMATEYRVYCPATIREKAIVPTADPETVFDIKYFSRDQRRVEDMNDQSSSISEGDHHASTSQLADMWWKKVLATEPIVVRSSLQVGLLFPL